MQQGTAAFRSLTSPNTSKPLQRKRVFGRSLILSPHFACLLCVNCPALLRGRVHVPSNRMSAPGAANLSRPGERLGGDRNRTGRRSSRLCKENFTQDFAGRGGESHSGRAHDRESPRCTARTQLVGTRGEAEPLSFSPNIPPAHRSHPSPVCNAFSIAACRSVAVDGTGSHH